MNWLNAVASESDADQSQPVRTYVDSSLLIAAVRGPLEYSGQALQRLREERRVYLSSDVVRLEVLPKAIFHRNVDEVAFYERFFASTTTEMLTTPELVAAAQRYAARWNLNGLDALHVAAAIAFNATELITAERPTSPPVRVRTATLIVISVREPIDE